MYNFNEILKLVQGLMSRNISFELKEIYGGWQVWVNNGEWDAICHKYSIGHEDGLLEIMGSIAQSEDDDVEGRLTAEEVLARL